MLLKDYHAKVSRLITECTESGLILSSDLMIDLRTEKIGLLKGELFFLDGSTLFFSEYIDLRYRIDKKMYSFHYQNAMSILIFRYDNARHKPNLGFDDHRHSPERTEPSTIPSLQDVLNEIINVYLIDR